MCLGLEARPNRVGQMGALWLRRRGLNNSWGTPAWAHDPGGDGILDGRDSALQAGPARTEEGRAAEEAVHFLTRFLVGGPISLYADRQYWGGGWRVIGDRIERR